MKLMWLNDYEHFIGIMSGKPEVDGFRWLIGFWFIALEID